MVGDFIFWAVIFCRNCFIILCRFGIDFRAGGGGIGELGEWADFRRLGVGWRGR